MDDFLRMLLQKTQNTEKDDHLKYMEYILRQDLIKYGQDGYTESDDTATSTKSANNQLENISTEKSLRDGFEEAFHPGVGGTEELNMLHKEYMDPNTSGAIGPALETSMPSTVEVAHDADSTGTPGAADFHSAPLRAERGHHDTGGHVVRVPVAGAVTLAVLFELLVFIFLLAFVVIQARRIVRARRDDKEGVGDDVEQGNKSDDLSSGVSCSTSTPYSSRHGSVYPGLCSALSENLHCMLPVMSPIDSPEMAKRCTFSGSPGVPYDVKSKQIQGYLSEDTPRSNTWLDFSPESKRALYAMTRSRSTPEQLAGRTSTWSDGDMVETNIGKIDPGIYKREQLAAKFVGKWKQVKSKKENGKLFFKISYDKEIELLTVSLDSGRNLPQTMKDGNGDFFVKIALDPDHKRRSMNSSIRHGTRNPDFKQNFAFRIARGAVSEMRIKFTVCEYDQYSHPIAIGRVEYALSDRNEEGTDDEKLIQRDLEKPEKEDEESTMGELMISLTYLPNAERVNLIIMKARNIRLPEWGDKDVGRSILDTFVKITIMRCGKVMKHKNTKVIRRSCSPVFNEAFSIDRMRLSEMPECCFVLSVCARLNHFRSHRIIGRCVVGGKDCAVGDGLAHWNEMSDTPRSIVARWHKIQP